MTFYNADRPNSALDRQTPDDAHSIGFKQQKAALNENPVHLKKAAKLAEKAGPFQAMFLYGSLSASLDLTRGLIRYCKTVLLPT